MAVNVYFPAYRIFNLDAFDIELLFETVSNFPIPIECFLKFNIFWMVYIK